MSECYQIKSAEEMMAYLEKNGREVIRFNYQLQTNYGLVYELENGEVVFLDHHFRNNSILFADKKCFDDIIKSDRFPLENPDKTMFESEGERMLTFHLQANYYRNHLNSVLKFDFQEITKESVQAYLKKVIGRYIKQLTTDTDIVALISVIGELVKADTNGKWFLEKRYGMYNPFYEPNMVTGDGNVFLISGSVYGSIKWRVSRLENFFIEAHSKGTAPLKWEGYAKARNNLIMLE